jgi:D-beta-D-heptose 7-phosphate kinase / D-beta-D-heptose 1-phosphate adenosyltransferase
VLVKGASQAIDDVVGADLMRGWGGRVLLIDLMEDHAPRSSLAPVKR